MTPHKKIEESHPSFQLGGSDAWCSPIDVIEPCEQFFGGRIYTDPCWNEHAITNPVVAYEWGGLHRKWLRQTYENPPFSKTHAFTIAALRNLTAGHCTELVRLTMVATSTAWWTLMTEYRRNPRFLFTKRLRFAGPKADGARFDTVLTYFGPRWKSFDKHFAHLNRWSTWGR